MSTEEEYHYLMGNITGPLYSFLLYEDLYLTRYWPADFYGYRYDLGWHHWSPDRGLRAKPISNLNPYQ